MRHITLLRSLVLVLALAGLAPDGAALAQGSATGTQYVTFWRGDLRIIATRPRTQITIVDVQTGAALSPTQWIGNATSNPFVLNDAGDAFEASSATVPPNVLTHRVRIVTTYASGPKEAKPIIVWTGALEATLKHPAAPPTTTNAWMSYLPALAPGSVENGAEIGRDFWGFSSREMYVFAKKGAVPTQVAIQDLQTNTDPDANNSVTLTPASPYKVIDDGFIEIYFLDIFNDDTLRVTANTDIQVLVGIGSQAHYDHTVTPASWGAGEDSRELGTLFYAYVQRDLTVFPTQDNTTVTVTDLSDGDDSTTVTLRAGDLNGDYDLFTTDLWARWGTGIATRPANPAVALHTLAAASAPYESDFVKVESDRPVLLYVGPKASDTYEYADVAYPVRTGPSSWLSYCYAQNGGAEDFQLFAFDAATSVSITSLTYTKGFGAQLNHDWNIPAPTAWRGGNATYNDWYWAHGGWSGEMLRLTSNGPITIMNGDYDGPNFGSFIPFVSDSGLLKPIADAGPDLDLCPGVLRARLDGSASFDTDSTPGALTPSWTWDLDPVVDGNGDGDPTNDVDLSGASVSFDVPGPGSYRITLTFTDDDGQTDSDELVVRVPVDNPPLLTCPPLASANADATGAAFVPVLAIASDDCDPLLVVSNDRTAGGADASDSYRCGATLVNFMTADSAGQPAACQSRVEVLDVTAPALVCPARIDALTDSPDGATVAVLASGSDNCDVAVSIQNDRTPNGPDASGFYPCGEITVLFAATDAAGNPASCPTLVGVTAAGPPPRIDLPLLGVKAPPASATWHFQPPVGAFAKLTRLWKSPTKDVVSTARVLVAEWPVTTTSFAETDALLAAPSCLHYQLVTVSCDLVSEGPY